MSTIQSGGTVEPKLANEARRYDIREEDIVPVPVGTGTFEFAILAGQTGPLSSFVESGADGLVVSDKAVKDLVVVKIRQGPIPIHGVAGKRVMVTGEWAAALPLDDGTYQAIQGLSFPTVARDWPELNLRLLLRRDTPTIRSFRS